MKLPAAGLVAAVLATACAEEPVVIGDPPEAFGIIRFRVEASGSVPAAGDTFAVVLLARTDEEGERAAGSAPVPEAAERLASWAQYEERALLAVFGGNQPDAGYRLEVVTVESPADREGTLQVDATVVRGSEAAIQVISVPWVLISVEADAVRDVDTCILVEDGEELSRTSCLPGR